MGLQAYFEVCSPTGVEGICHKIYQNLLNFPGKSFSSKTDYFLKIFKRRLNPPHFALENNIMDFWGYPERTFLCKSYIQKCLYNAKTAILILAKEMTDKPKSPETFPKMHPFWKKKSSILE